MAMVQVKQDVEKVSSELFQRATAGHSSEAQATVTKTVAQVQSFLAEPQNIASALSVGVAAVQKALPLFTASPPQIMEGFMEFGSGLFDAVAMMVTEETRSSDKFAAFREAWDETAQTLPGVVEGFERGVTAYREDGDVVALMEVWSTALDRFGSAVTTYLPGELGQGIAKLLTAVEDALEGFDDAMQAFAEGSTATAIESMYSGIRSASDALLPEDAKNETAYVAIVGALDAVFTNLSSTVMEYQQSLLSSKVCWKDFARRERKRPSVCPANYHWDGEHWCYRGGAALLEGAVAGKRPRGAVPSRCEEDGEFHEKRGSWCHKDCPSGLEPAGARCKSSCMGVYPIDSPLMCGKSRGTVAAAIAEMATRTLKAGLTAASIINDSGVEGLGGTVTVLVEAGKGFAHPKCPMVEAS